LGKSVRCPIVKGINVFKYYKILHLNVLSKDPKKRWWEMGQK